MKLSLSCNNAKCPSRNTCARYDEQGKFTGKPRKGAGACEVYEAKEGKVTGER